MTTFAANRVGRKPINLAGQSLIKTNYLNDRQLPLVIEPALAGVELKSWASLNRAYLAQELARHGAILFRNFEVQTAEDFQEIIAAVSEQPLPYMERSSPRTKVSGNIYTSTEYPAEQEIFLHNEHSYSQTFPLKLFFCSLQAAVEGGETPLADCRRVLARLSEGLKRRFSGEGWRYVRNFGYGFGLPWQTVFQTEDRAAVEAYCRKAAIEVEWQPQNRLRTWQKRPALLNHPHDGQLSWFNHITFFHVSTLEPTIQQVLQSEFAQDELPNNTYYGDGAVIEPEVLEELRAAYLAEKITFPWQNGDVLLVDNILVAHGRASYSGPRRLLVGMAEAYQRPAEEQLAR